MLTAWRYDLLDLFTDIEVVAGRPGHTPLVVAFIDLQASARL
jgi:hypothetical protein